MNQNDLSLIDLSIYGAGGGKGGGRAFREADDSLEATARVKVLEVLSEGQIKGIKGGAKGIYLNDTPLQNEDGSFNFGGGVIWDYRNGLPSQPYMPGFEAAAAEAMVNAEIKTTTPQTRTTTSGDIDAVRVTIQFPQGLSIQQTKENALVGTKVELAVDVKASNSGNWVVAHNWVVDGKTGSPYEEAVRISRPAGTTGTWDIRVRRITPDATSSLVRDSVTWSRLTEIQEVKLEYEDTAYIGISVDAASAGSSTIPTRSAIVEGLIVKVPSNYNPELRIHEGVWDQQWKMAFTNNPAWVLYDAIAHPRYGMGEWLTEDHIDAFSFYDAALYCDQKIPNGKGGLEPRYQADFPAFQREEGLSLIQKIAGIMNAKIVWQGNLVTVVQDRKALSVAAAISTANVYTGENGDEPPFTYSGSALPDRITAVNVTWNDPADRYLQRVSTVEADSSDITKYGYNSADIAAFGTTTEGQAQRKGKWYLESVLSQVDSVKFKMSYEGFALEVGEVVEILDENYAGVPNGGRLLAGSTTNELKLDRPASLGPTNKIHVHMPDGSVVQRDLLQTGGSHSTVNVVGALPFAPAEYASYTISSNVQARQFRITSITSVDTNLVEVSGLQYDANKYDRIDLSADLPPPVYSNVTDSAISVPVDLVFREQAINQDNTIYRSILASWQRPHKGIPVRYNVSWRVNQGNWNQGETSQASFEILNAVPGFYEFKVTATSFAGITSPAAVGSYHLDVNGGSASVLNAPTDLVEQLTGHATEFGGLDLNIKWKNPLSNGGAAVTLRDFEVQFFETVGNTSVRTVYVPAVAPGQTQNFSYTFAMNVQDGGPRRKVRVEVRCRDTSNNLSDSVVAVFTNPPPPQPLNIEAIGAIQGVKITFTPNYVSDLKGYLLWGSTTPGFVPSETNLLRDGQDNYISLSALPDLTTYYYRLAAYDDFDRPLNGVGLNLSAEFSATTTVPPGVPGGPTLPPNSTPGTIFWNTSDNNLYRYDGTEWTKEIDIDNIRGQVDSTHIAPGAVTTLHLQAGSVGANELKANLFTAGSAIVNNLATAILVAGSITASMLAVDSVTSDKIKALAVNATHIDTRGLILRDVAGNVVFQSGVPLSANMIPTVALNSQITMNANGQLVGGGGGQVTLPGMGYKSYRVLTKGSLCAYGGSFGLTNGTTGAQLVGVTRGYVVTWFNRATGEYQGYETFDTYGANYNSPVSGNHLSSVLNWFTNGHIVCIYSWDEPKSNRMQFAEGFYRNGASPALFGSPEFKFQSAYVLVGVGGCGKGNGTERYMGSVDGDPTAFIDFSFSIQNMNLLVGPGGTPNSIRDYSYTGNMNASLDILLVAKTSNVKIEGNSVTKTGTSYAWDGAFNSGAQIFHGGAWVSAQVPQGNVAWMIGLGSDQWAGTSYERIDFALYVSAEPSSVHAGHFRLIAYEKGAGIDMGAWAVYAPGDTIWIVYDGSHVRYYRNGSQLRVVYAGAARSLAVDASMATVGGTIANIRYGNGAPPLSTVQASNPISATNASTYIYNAAIGSAQVGTLLAGNIGAGQITADKINVWELSAMTARVGTLRTATSGQRTEISDNQIRVYDSSNVLRVLLGQIG